MGCTASKSKSSNIPQNKIVPFSSLLPPEKAGSFKVRILEAVKKKDPILFEKTLQQYKVKISELITGFDLHRTVLHHIAEANFADGMTLLLNYIIQKEHAKVSQVLTSVDAEGNTPGMVCCICNSPETLDVVIKHEAVDLSIKNSEGKTALELAFENSLACVNLLTSLPTTTNSKITSKLYLGSVEQLLSPRNNNRQSSLIDRRTSRKHTKSLFDSRDLSSVPLTSVLSLTKEGSSKLGPSSRLFSLINKLKETDGIEFVDQEFPHTTFSIFGEEVMESFGTSSPALRWARPTEFLSSDFKKIKLFEAIDLNDTSKSGLAGCDLYSALAAMTEFPQRLINTFTVKETNKYGAYSVKFLISGIPIEIVLDDYFPCNDNQNLLFSRPLTNELWFLLLEKAFAKLYGSYNEIRNVDISEALELMTGMPSYQHNLCDLQDEELWDRMMSYDRKNYIFCAGTYNKRHENKKKNRIFAIVSLYEMEQFKIVKLRDHFQNFEWEGMFSEKSKTWTKELREAIGYTKGESSCIYMELQEFIKHFEFLSVCHYHDGWIRNRVDAVSDPHTAMLFELTLDQETELFISVHQKLPRYVDSPDYGISPVEVLLAEKLEDNSLRKIAAGEKDSLIGKQTTYVNPGIKIRLSEGKYIIRVKIRWVDQREHDFTLGVLSSRDLTLRQIKKEEYPNFLERVFVDAGFRARERYQLKNNCEFISAWCGPHLWIYASNRGNKTWGLEIAFQILGNLKIPKKYMADEDGNLIKMEIPPNEQRAVYATRINADMVEILWNLNHVWK